MRGAFELRDPASPRMDIAVQLMSDGTTFHFKGIAFTRDRHILRCHALSPWGPGTGLHEPQARELLDVSRAVLDELKNASHQFSSAVSDLTPQFGIDSYDDWDGYWPIVTEAGGKLEWHRFQPSASAD